jgi:hypothetical protein
MCLLEMKHKVSVALWLVETNKWFNIQLLHSLDEDDRSLGQVDSPTLSRAAKDAYHHHLSEVSIHGWVLILLMKSSFILIGWNLEMSLK